MTFGSFTQKFNNNVIFPQFRANTLKARGPERDWRAILSCQCKTTKGTLLFAYGLISLILQNGQQRGI